MIAAKAQHAPSSSGLGGLNRLWHVLERLEGPIPYGALGRGYPDATRGKSSQERTQLATPE